MRFIKNELGKWEVLIKKEWYHLCACIKCGEVHAGDVLIKVDKKIKCCEKPNNWACGEYSKVDCKIDEFVKKWSD
uniref:Uncharacterized protein n=1 Tax=viral metagenome TaxID=1070528 RepID=A0A6H1ZQR2_9ZZZZ